jgi:hypothetical protein
VPSKKRLNQPIGPLVFLWEVRDFSMVAQSAVFLTFASTTERNMAETMVIENWR